VPNDFGQSDVPNAFRADQFLLSVNDVRDWHTCGLDSVRAQKTREDVTPC
jgi:hypothetical protein